MTEPKKDRDLVSPLNEGLARLLMGGLVPPALTSLRRALGISAAYDWRLDLEDIDRVESMWELLDLDSTSHGFVIALEDGRRCYLQYVMAPGDNDDIVEDVETLPMGDERYPDLKGGGICWSDDVRNLNQLLKE
jgi:hypothetical protein